MAAKNTIESESDYNVSIDGETETLHFCFSHLKTVSLEADIETRNMNQYLTFETTSEQSESRLASGTKKDIAFVLWVGDGGFQVANIHSPLARSDPNAVEAKRLWDDATTEWDVKIAPGIWQKTVSRHSNQREKGSKCRTRIEREAVDRARENNIRLFVLEYEARSGARAAPKGSDTEWDSHEAVRAIELIP